MIDGLPLEYSLARAASRLGQRPDERLWVQLRAIQDMAALLERLRASPAAALVSGIAPASDSDAVELAFRQRLRLHIDEFASWVPRAWRDGVRATRSLVDLPALLHLLGEDAPPRWLRHDPELAGYALPTQLERRAALLDGPHARLVTLFEQPAVATAALPAARGSGIHPLLAAWESDWRCQWPAATSAERAALDELVLLLRQHVVRFASMPATEAAAARQALGERLRLFVRRHSGVAVLFATLALLALDLEALRGEFMRRLKRPGAAP
jgi:hypothetical protein